MDIETAVIALESAIRDTYSNLNLYAPDHQRWQRVRARQIETFSAYIVKKDTKKQHRLDEWEVYHGFYMGDIEMIETITDKDAEIVRLKAENIELLESFGVYSAGGRK